MHTYALLLSLHMSEDVAYCLQLEAESRVPESAKFWCPQRNCSNLMIVQKTTHAEVECLVCKTYLCTICRSFGHSGMTCSEAKVRGCTVIVKLSDYDFLLVVLCKCNVLV